MKNIIILLVVVLMAFVGCNGAPDSNNMQSSEVQFVPSAPEMHNAASKSDSSKEDSRKEQMEQIRLQKIAYMTDHLKLTVEESKVFWPVYFQYWEQAMQLQHDENVVYKRINKSETSSMSDIDTLVSFCDRRAQLISTWSKEFGKVIPENKVAKVFAAEERFKNYLIRKGTWKSQKQK